MREACCTGGDANRDGKTNADEDFLFGWVDQACDDTDDLTISIQQWTSRVARIDSGVELD